jgi:hypothetical protein
MKATVRATRDRRANDPDFLQWQKEYQAEQDAATAEAGDADPVAKAQKAMDAEAQAVLEIIRTGYIPDSLLSGVERINGRVLANEKAAISNWKYSRTHAQRFSTGWRDNSWTPANAPIWHPLPRTISRFTI